MTEKVFSFKAKLFIDTQNYAHNLVDRLVFCFPFWALVNENCLCFGILFFGTWRRKNRTSKTNFNILMKFILIFHHIEVNSCGKCIRIFDSKHSLRASLSTYWMAFSFTCAHIFWMLWLQLMWQSGQSTLENGKKKKKRNVSILQTSFFFCFLSLGFFHIFSAAIFSFCSQFNFIKEYSFLEYLLHLQLCHSRGVVVQSL